jgi:hypothetical protein
VGRHRGLHRDVAAGTSHLGSKHDFFTEQPRVLGLARHALRLLRGCRVPLRVGAWRAAWEKAVKFTRAYQY